MYLKFLDKIDLLVLCGGKCGSSTLYATLNRNAFKSIKVHGRDSFINQFNYDGLYDFINRSSSNKKLYIVDSYRTPIERKISSFFQNLENHVPDYKNKKVKELINIFNNKYLNNLENGHPIDIIMKNYNVKPFYKFNFEKKYVKKVQGNLVFIKILFSDINDWGNILSKIFNKKIIVVSSNLSKKKDQEEYINKWLEKSF